MQLTVKQARSCGDCTACCTIIGVHELGKPYYQTCKRLEGYGCSQYARRPPSCRRYRCLWLQGLGRERPNVSGVLINPTDSPFLDCYETRAGGWSAGKQEVVQIARQFPRYTGIAVYLHGSKVGINFRCAPCYEDRAEYYFKAAAVLTETVDGIPIYFAQEP